MIDTRVQNYRILSLIDEGGMGTVYKAVHMQIGRYAAIKVLNPLLISKPEIKNRFKNEAINLSKLSHPNIVKIYDYIETPQGIFIILEYIEGQTLDKYIKEFSGPVPEKRAIELFKQMLEALTYLHSKDIIHRDIKPSNFIITKDNEIKLIDFGIAQEIGLQANKITKDGTKVGTTIYMSPQQIRGQILDRRTDIYSLGATFFEILTGQPPYDSNNSEYDISNSIVNENFPNPRDFYVGISFKMQNIILKATAKRPLDRYQSCQEFSNAILDFKTENVEQKNVVTKQNITTESSIPLKNKSFWRNLIAFLIISVVVALFGIVIFSIQKESYRHIVANSTFLFAADSLNAAKLEVLDYGETVKLLSTQNTKNSAWIEVVSLRGKKGYVNSNEVANNKIFEQINLIFADNYAQENTQTKYKWFLRKYFVENKLFDPINLDWKIYYEPKPEQELNTICVGDFDSNNETDYACVLKNTKNEKSKLIIFFDNETDNFLIDFEEPIKIKILKQGHEGGNWFIGNTTTQDDIVVKKFEPLPNDAILVYKSQNQENIIYIYNKEEKMLNVYLQN